MTNPLHHIYNGLSKTFDYSGRASRSEYWWTFGFMLLFTSIWQSLLFLTIFDKIDNRAFAGGFTMETFPIALVLNISFLIFTPTMLALVARRFQDRGWSGRWFKYIAYFTMSAFVCFLIAIGGYVTQIEAAALYGLGAGIYFSIIPYLSIVWTTWAGFARPQPADNSYGPNPLEVSS